MIVMSYLIYIVVPFAKYIQKLEYQKLIILAELYDE